MTISIAQTPGGTKILLTDEHPVCLLPKIPVVTIGVGRVAKVLGKADLVETNQGVCDASRLVIQWLEDGPVREGPGLLGSRLHSSRITIS